ncbi:hypothetical protein SKM57_06410 [Acinetobacter faecalis]|uniref:hypothetical protein n=1 Tax=Acinetobacter faecalis TaxID=2665161 RepID=UPI002A90EECC|nr:hypothetical protein [Acinetobacter faecalis]MDY6457409.1 hypothetical protein [Acinetobacter faecalis]MDY6468217.1 hypothetical protein [Acinetobacter faecalis]
MEISEAQYWINVYGIVFSILVISLSINFTFFIRDKITRILSIIVCTALITRVINKVFSMAYIGLMEQDPFLTFIFKGVDKNIFAGVTPFCISVIAFILLIFRVLYKRKKAGY